MLEFAYENDANGNTVSGDKDTLIAAIMSGRSIRVLIVYDDATRVTAIDASAVFVRYGEVFAQVSWASASWQPPNRDQMTYLEPHSEYMVILSTTGYASRRKLTFPEASTADKTNHYGVKWYLTS